MKGNPENFSQNGNLPLTNTDLTKKIAKSVQRR